MKYDKGVLVYMFERIDKFITPFRITMWAFAVYLLSFRVDDEIIAKIIGLSFFFFICSRLMGNRFHDQI